MSNHENERGPLLGEPAPDFQAVIAGHTIKLNDFRGKWIVILSHPEDILPLFKTRTVQYLLCKRRTKVIALGFKQTEGIESGRNLLKKYILKHNLTILDDSDAEIAKKYCLPAASDKGLKGVKGVFIIDQKGILRAKLYLPLTAERNFYEVLRLIDVLQSADSQKMLNSDKKTLKRLDIVIKHSTVAGEGRTV